MLAPNHTDQLATIADHCRSPLRDCCACNWRHKSSSNVQCNHEQSSPPPPVNYNLQQQDSITTNTIIRTTHRQSRHHSHTKPTIDSHRHRAPPRLHKPSSTRNNNGRISTLLLMLVTCTPILTTTLLSETANGVVVHQIRFIENKTGRTDYALTGETIELSCYYMMKDEAEDVKQIIWSKDGKNFLKWRKNRAGLDVLSYIFKGHIDQSSMSSHLIINNVSIDMHGKYKCQVKTDLGTHELEQDLIVISQAGCKLNDWRISSEQMLCRETFKLDCRNMFPKPVPSCGLWNGRLDKFIRSVTVDISEEPNKETYRVTYSDKFDLPKTKPSPASPTRSTVPMSHNQTKQLGNQSPSSSSRINNVDGSAADLLQYADHLIFKCDILVPDTSWKLSLAYKMFDYAEDGCFEDPLETIEMMRANYSHFTATRMQQAGYLMTTTSDGGGTNAPTDFHKYHPQSQHNRLDDIEMITSSLKYDLLPSPRRRSEAKDDRSSGVDLNCWHKPRPGTLAKLSCSRNNNQVKLTGTNLLECQTDGLWHPIKLVAPPSSSNRHQNNKLIGRKLPRKFRSDPSADSNADDDQIHLDNTLDSNDHPSNESTTTTTLAPTTATGTHHPADDSNTMRTYTNDVNNHGSKLGGNDDNAADDDDDSASTISNKQIPSESHQMSIPKLITTTTTATTTTTMPPPTTTSGDNLPTINVIETSNLTPAQLAALLPTCVSTISRKPSSRSQGGRFGSPHDEAAIVLESSQYGKSSGSHHHTSSKYQDGDNSSSSWKWLTIFSSSSSAASSSPTTAINSNHQGSLITSIGICVVATQLVLHHNLRAASNRLVS